MQTFQTVLLIVHLVLAAGLIGLVLLQRSEGGALGVGGGGGGGLISGRGAADALVRGTAILGGLFFLTSMTLTLLADTTKGVRSAVDAIAPVERAADPEDATPPPPPVRAAPLVEDVPPGATVAPSPQSASERAAPAIVAQPVTSSPPPLAAAPPSNAPTRPAAPAPRPAPTTTTPAAAVESPQTAPPQRSERAGPDE